MRILAITGGIATGKSAVTQMLGALGAPMLSADVLARDLLQPGTQATRAVLDAFPGCAEAHHAGALDRRALGRLVFADADARALLESLTHPPVIRALQEAAADWRATHGGCAALEIPLLFEVGLEAIGDTLVVAACSLSRQLARVQARGGIGEAEARRQIAAQWPLEEKAQRANWVIDTDGTLEDTRAQVAALWESECA